jgi:hypothetical protein
MLGLAGLEHRQQKKGVHIMGFKTASFHIRGVAPTLLHNGQTCDPGNRFAKAMKKITSKRAKTDQDYEELKAIEWQAAMYADEMNRPCWPGECIESMIISAAKKLKLGQTVKSAVFCAENWPILFERKGAKTVSAIADDPSFYHTCSVKIGQNRIMRTRPIFRDWSLKFDVQYNDEHIELDTLQDIIKIAGAQIGLSDYRPKYGRFIVL